MMLFESTNRRAPKVNLAEALIQGQAPDTGLYLPIFIPYFAAGELAALQNKTYPEIAVAVLKVHRRYFPCRRGCNVPPRL